ncbi:tetratricopeptide repeat protein [Hoylesella marshii]|uniref:tetratricopeptide repeat protein n=1 Tax=Hoylesella marshii TaxID=189722 RepID=UPI0028D8C74B|nr:tetratricopeptide repeat protein [Hoylesella marshii]
MKRNDIHDHGITIYVGEVCDGLPECHDMSAKCATRQDERQTMPSKSSPRLPECREVPAKCATRQNECQTMPAKTSPRFPECREVSAKYATRAKRIRIASLSRTYTLYIYITLLLIIGGISAHAQSDRQFIRNGNQLYHERNYAKAEVEYRKALDKNHNNTHAAYNLGCALMMQKKDSVAIQQFENAAKAEPNKLRRAQSYHNIGVVCQQHRMYAEAIAAYKNALRNNPSDNETRYNLALCKRLLKQQPQNKQNQQNKQNDKNKNQQNGNNKNQPEKDENKKDKSNPQQPKEQMSKENAEQLLNAAMQEEKATQQRLKKAMQQPRTRKLEKNW